MEGSVQAPCPAAGVPDLTFCDSAAVCCNVWLSGPRVPQEPISQAASCRLVQMASQFDMRRHHGGRSHHHPVREE